MLIASDMSSSSCCLTIPCSCCLAAVAERRMIYSVCHLLWGTFRVFLLLWPPPFLCSRSFRALTSRLFPSLGYLSAVLSFCNCFLGFLVHNASTLKSLPCPVRLGACPCSLFEHREHEIPWHVSAGPGAEVHRPSPCLVAPHLSKGDPPVLWGIWMKILNLAFNGWWSLLSHLSPKIGEELPRAVREQNRNPSKLLLLCLSHFKDYIGRCCNTLCLKAIRIAFPKTLENNRASRLNSWVSGSF